MSNLLGYGLSFLFLVLIISGIIAIFYLSKAQKKIPLIILKWTLALLPMIYLFIIGEGWVFGTNFLPSQITDDLTYSIFHIGALFLLLVGAVFMVKKAQKDRDSTRNSSGRLNQIDQTIFYIGIMMFGIEIYKQLIYLDLAGGLSTYQWYGFPFQFCSVPIFLYPLAPLITNLKVKSALYSFIGIFTLVGGLSVMLVGGSVFSLYVSISIHTMIWHGAMVAVGLYTLVSQRIGRDFKAYFNALKVLFILIIVVQVLNLTFELSGIHDFDGFFISPWQSNVNMPVLSNIRINLQNMNMPLVFVGIVFSLIYFAVFTLGGLIVFMVGRLFYLKKHSPSPLVSAG